MAERNKRLPSWAWTVVVLVLIAVPGFGLGLVAGVAWEDPSLLGSHLLGGTTEVAAWTPGATTRDPDAELAPVVAEPVELPNVGAGAPQRAAPTTRVAAQAPVPARKPAAPATAGRFAVQVGAFGEVASAERLAQQLRSKGYTAYVSPGVAAGEPRWRVRVGPSAEREKADADAARLKSEEQLPTWVLDENSGG